MERLDSCGDAICDRAQRYRQGPLTEFEGRFAVGIDGGSEMKLGYALGDGFGLAPDEFKRCRDDTRRAVAPGAQLCNVRADLRMTRA
jgi:hypothetical protein